MKTYKLVTQGNSKIQAALVKLCQMGQVGEPLALNGLSQGSFCGFLARFVIALQAAGRDENQIATALCMVSGGNASAANKALAEAVILFDDEDLQHRQFTSLGKYWASLGGTAASADLSLLDI